LNSEKLILKNKMKIWTGLMWLKTGMVAGPCKCNNESQDSAKGREFLE
jgi:hypothetical protein